MTIREAIDLLKIDKRIHKHSKEHAFVEAIDMAIEALSAEPKITKVRKDGALFVTVLDAEKVKKVLVNDLQGFCNTFCEEPKQDDDSDYDSLVPDEYKTEPSDNIEGDIDFHCDLKHNRMTWFNNITESPNDVVETENDVIEKMKSMQKELGVKAKFENLTEPSDLISRADAIAAIRKCKFDSVMPSYWYRGMECAQDIISAFPSAEIPTNQQKHQLSEETPTNTPTGLISRADAIEAVRKKLQDWGSYAFEDYRRGLYEAQDIIDALPSAEAVQGEWVRKEREYNDCDGHYAHYWYECSVCGARPPKDQWKNEWHSNYCPSCGARMKGGAE